MTTPRDILAICFSTIGRHQPSTTNGELADFALAELQKAGYAVVLKEERARLPDEIAADLDAIDEAISSFSGLQRTPLEERIYNVMIWFRNYAKPPDGWKLVPIVATPQMESDGQRTLDNRWGPQAMYRVMIDAAPMLPLHANLDDMMSGKQQRPMTAEEEKDTKAFYDRIGSYIPKTPTNEDIDKWNAEREASIAVRHGEQKP